MAEPVGPDLFCCFLKHVLVRKWGYFTLTGSIETNVAGMSDLSVKSRLDMMLSVTGFIYTVFCLTIKKYNLGYFTLTGGY